MSIQLCQRCNKAKATVHLTDIVPPDGEKRERHLCERCAREEGLVSQHHESISNILESFVKHASGMSEAPDTKCPNCGMTFREFRSTGLLGCPNDYQVFEKPLTVLIERAHEQATHHVGKTPGQHCGEPTRPIALAKLKREMRESVEEEDYERAARLRDEINKLEQA